jgi:hypothetical protein
MGPEELGCDYGEIPTVTVCAPELLVPLLGALRLKPVIAMRRVPRAVFTLEPDGMDILPALEQR